MDDFFEAADLWDADEWLPDPDSEPDPDEESSSEPESDELPEEESVKIQIICIISVGVALLDRYTYVTKQKKQAVLLYMTGLWHNGQEKT